MFTLVFGNESDSKKKCFPSPSFNFFFFFTQILVIFTELDMLILQSIFFSISLQVQHSYILERDLLFDFFYLVRKKNKNTH